MSELNGTINGTFNAGGIAIPFTIARSAPGALPAQQVDLPPADAGSLTTRTSDTAGTLTMTSGTHGITTGAEIDIFWVDANGLQKCAYGCTVGTVSGTSVPFTFASGDVLPAQAYAITADVVVPLDVDFDGDLLQLVAAASTKAGKLVFEDVGDAVLDHATLLANELWSWVKNSSAGLTNPLGGNPVDQIKISNADSAVAATFRFGGLYDSDG